MSYCLPELEPRLRFPASTKRAFGPGKADLLRNIVATGSIARSAARMKMSYNRAWLLVRDMNRLFREPLVMAVRGGNAGGGAQLTLAGKEVLRRYTRMEAACRKATRSEWKILYRKLRF
jgi:molybdate transport system regulatory protein